MANLRVETRRGDRRATARSEPLPQL